MRQSDGGDEMSGQDVFICGALQIIEVLQAVIGSTGEVPDVSPASLSGLSCVNGVLHPAEGDEAVGALLRDVQEAGQARLRYYCAVFGQVQARVEVSAKGGSDILTFVGDPSDVPVATPTEAVQIRMAIEIMGYFERYPPDYVAARLFHLQRRAQSYVMAQAMPADPDHDLNRDVVVRQHVQPYLNFFAMQESDLQYRRYDGRLGEVVNRGTLHVGQVVAVLPYDPLRDCVLLIEQFRAPLYMGGSPAPWIWQPIAGLIDPGDTPETAAHREAQEEAGLTLTRLEPAGQVYTSPGSSTEFVYLYIGLADLSEVQAFGGLEIEGEDIRSQVLGFDALMHMADRGEIRDMPLLTSTLWLARHRDRLRITA